jgi:hypothetical protein
MTWSCGMYGIFCCIIRERCSFSQNPTTLLVLTVPFCAALLCVVLLSTLYLLPR